MTNSMTKAAYICGPLTELPIDEQVQVKLLYEQVGAACEEVLGVPSFVPHQHYDPIRNASATPGEVDSSERKQVCTLTSVLVVLPVAPSWGGGIEVEMARQSNVPVVLLCEKTKLEARKISRLLRGNPAVKSIVAYNSEDESLELLKTELRNLKLNGTNGFHRTGATDKSLVRFKVVLTDPTLPCPNSTVPCGRNREMAESIYGNSGPHQGATLYGSESTDRDDWVVLANKPVPRHARAR